MPLFTPEQRQETVDRVVALLSADERVEGCVLVGSLAGEHDGWSDADVVAVVAEPEAVARDWLDRVYRKLPVVHPRVAAERGRLWQSLWYLERVRSRALAQERHGSHADFFDEVDELPPDELKPYATTLPSSLDRSELLRALGTATSAFLGELRRGDPALAERLEGPLLQLAGAKR